MKLRTPSFALSSIACSCASRTPSPIPAPKQKARCTRRELLVSLPLAATIASLQVPSYPANATRLVPTPDELQREFAEVAANIPGLGQADVFYPEFFRGEWRVDRTLYSIQESSASNSSTYLSVAEDPVLGAEAVRRLRGRLGRLDRYRLRFYKHRGKIVEDRAFNMRNEVSTCEFPDLNISASWSPDNPNVISVSGSPKNRSIIDKYTNTDNDNSDMDIAREVKITKRAFSEPKGKGTFLSSEYARVVDFNDETALLGAGKGSPHISAWRKISRYQVNSLSKNASTGAVEPNGMNRITVEYRYTVNNPEGDPSITLKYREFLTKLK